MKTGMLAAESAYDVVHPSTSQASSSSSDESAASNLSGYEEAFKKSWVYEDLHEVRNLRPSFNTKLGIWGGIMYSGIDSLFLRGRTPWTFRHAPHQQTDVKEKNDVRSLRFPPLVLFELI